MSRYFRPALGIPILLILSFFLYYKVISPLPFYSFFSDPELPYFLNSVMLAFEGQVEHTDHPGTGLQLAGAVLSRLLGIAPAEVFTDSAIQLFRGSWQVVSLLLTLLLVVFLWRSLEQAGRGWMFVCLLALLFADYNSLIYWGTFTPEGAFTVLFIPVMVLLLKRFHKGPQVRVAGLFGCGLLLGLATTIKLTLWPVTLFVIGVYAITCSGNLRHRLVRTGLFFGITLVTFLIVGSIFAADPQAQWAWVFSLLQNSGRYGHAQEADPGSFLSASQILQWTISGLRLQNFATVVPMVLLGWLAVADALDRKAALTSRLTALGFLFCFLLTWLAFAKHPYQIKYLLVQTPLFVGFWYQRLLSGSMPFPKYFHLATTALLMAVLMTSLVNQRAVHVVTLAIDQATRPFVDQAITTLQPEMLYFSLEVRHPLSAKAFALREARTFDAVFQETLPPARIFRERTRQYTIDSSGRVPIATPVPGSLIFTVNAFNDHRLRLLHADNNAGLHIYLYPPAG
ncbi:MAG: hypothetical protein AB3N64_00855 [Puniceicoccaceae bacterium]